MNRITLQLLGIALLAAPLYADPASTQPDAILCPVATQLQTHVIDVAPKCVATPDANISNDLMNASSTNPASIRLPARFAC